MGLFRGISWRVDAVGGVVGAGLVVVAGVLSHAPVEASEERVGLLESELEEARGEADGLASRAAGLRAELARVEGELARTEVALRPGSSVNSQIARIATLAEETDLRLAEVRPGEGVTLDTHTERPVVLRGRAPFPAVMDFVREVESRFIDLGLRSLVVGESRGGDGGTEFEMELVWFADRAGGGAG